MDGGFVGAAVGNPVGASVCFMVGAIVVGFGVGVPNVL
jgi:hypothetical protein